MCIRDSRQGDLFADVRCAHEREDHPDHRHRRPAVGQADLPRQHRRICHLLRRPVRLLVPDLQEQATCNNKAGGAGEGDDEARKLTGERRAAIKTGAAFMGKEGL